MAWDNDSKISIAQPFFTAFSLSYSLITTDSDRPHSVRSTRHGSLQQVPALANQNGNQWRIQQCSLRVRPRLVRATVKLCAS